jgi:hypothetical protein
MEFSQFIIAILGMLFPIGIVAIIFAYENKSEARYHDTMLKLIENGQTLNEEVLSGIPGYKKKGPRNDIRSGWITAAVGMGITLLGMVALGSVIFGAGLLVLCIGVALFAYGMVARHTNIIGDKDA